jgi:hypothetical protein
VNRRYPTDIDWSSSRGSRRPTSPSDERLPCEDCGAPLGGRAECDLTFHELGARAAVDAGFAYRRRAIVDAYSLQHPAYILSLKSFAAHLCGLCAAVERASDPRAGRAIWSDLRVPPHAAKPAVPEARGSLTVATVAAARTPEDFRAAADAWIQSVWDAWSVHHDLARQWLDYAIAQPPRRKR